MIGVICLVGLALTIGIFVSKQIQQMEQQNNYEQMLGSDDEAYQRSEEIDSLSGETESEEAIVDETSTAEESLEDKYQIIEKKYGIEIPRKELDFQRLQEETNKDIYAWIYLPNTKIDYPILQHPSDDFYYLKRNVDGSKGYPGCIYTESKNSKLFTDMQTVLYGHNMKNGTMFAGLHLFEDSKFFDENPYFYIYTEDNIYVYQIFIAYKYSDKHLLECFDTQTEAGIENYLEEIRNYRSLTRNARENLLDELTAKDKICTLSTCVSGQDTARYLVQGVLLYAE